MSVPSADIFPFIPFSTKSGSFGPACVAGGADCSRSPAGRGHNLPAFVREGRARALATSYVSAGLLNVLDCRIEIIRIEFFFLAKTRSAKNNKSLNPLLNVHGNLGNF